MEPKADPVIDRRSRSYPAGAVLFREGDVSREMYIIRSGQVRIEKRVGAESICLALLGEGDFFGEMGVVDDLPRSASAVAGTQAVVVSIDVEMFQRILSENAELGRRLIRHLSLRLRQADERLVHLITRGEVARLAAALTQAATAVQERSDGRLLLAADLDAAALAGTAGLLPSTVEALLARLTGAGLLGRAEDGRWWVSGRADLEALVEYGALKRRYDPLTLDEVAELSGLSLAEAQVVAERVIRKRLSQVGAAAVEAVVQTPLQRYLELKLRFEFTQASGGTAHGGAPGGAGPR